MENKTATINIKLNNIGLATPCIVCGESVKLTPNEEITLRYGHDIHRKICDKCKQAILYIREQVEKSEYESI